MTPWYRLWCETCRDHTDHEIKENKDKKNQVLTCTKCKDEYICKIINERLKIQKDIFEGYNNGHDRGEREEKGDT